jgi:hypothetical protein
MKAGAIVIIALLAVAVICALSMFVGLFFRIQDMQDDMNDLARRVEDVAEGGREVTRRINELTYNNKQR